MSFGALEDSLQEKTRSALTNADGRLAVREVGALPGDLRDAETLRELVRSAPAVYWAFVGGRQDIGGDEVHMASVWSGYFITAHRGDQQDRRRGDGRQIGAFEMLRRVLPVIHGHTFDGFGTARLLRAENLFGLEVDKMGAALYAATFEIPLSLPLEVDADSLAGFVTYHADHSLVPGGDEPAAEDNVTLPQE